VNHSFSDIAAMFPIGLNVEGRGDAVQVYPACESPAGSFQLSAFSRWWAAGSAPEIRPPARRLWWYWAAASGSAASAGTATSWG